MSGTAVAAARSAFGDHFVLADDPAINAQAPYDVIFHVGTIGCVANPIEMTRRLLRWLKPGGLLLFNAPNCNACVLKDQIWFHSAPPPDLVTLFSPKFWGDCFSDAAEIDEQIEFCSPNDNLRMALRKLAGRKWRQPAPISLSESGRWSTPAPKATGSTYRALARLVTRSAAWTGLDRFAPRYPTEYGLFVQMIKK